MSEKWPSRVVICDEKGNCLWFNPNEATATWKPNPLYNAVRPIDGYVFPILNLMPSGAWCLWDEDPSRLPDVKVAQTLSENEAVALILKWGLDPGPHGVDAVQGMNIGGSKPKDKKAEFAGSIVVPSEYFVMPYSHIDRNDVDDKSRDEVPIAERVRMVFDNQLKEFVRFDPSNTEKWSGSFIWDWSDRQSDWSSNLKLYQSIIDETLHRFESGHWVKIVQRTDVATGFAFAEVLERISEEQAANWLLEHDREVPAELLPLVKGRVFDPKRPIELVSTDTSKSTESDVVNETVSTQSNTSPTKNQTVEGSIATSTVDMSFLESTPSRVEFRDEKGDFFWFNPREAVASWKPDSPQQKNKPLNAYLQPVISHMPNGKWFLWDCHLFLPNQARCSQLLTKRDAVQLILEWGLDPGNYGADIVASMNIGVSDVKLMTELPAASELDEHIFCLWDSAFEQMVPFVKITGVIGADVDSMFNHLQEKSEEFELDDSIELWKSNRNSDVPVSNEEFIHSSETRIFRYSRNALLTEKKLFNWIQLCKSCNDAGAYNGGVFRQRLDLLRQWANESIDELREFRERNSATNGENNALQGGCNNAEKPEKARLVFDQELKREVRFDPRGCQKWGPIERQNGWNSFEECPETIDIETLYRFQTGHWVLISDVTYYVIDHSVGESLTRLTDEQAANWLLLNEFEIPTDLQHHIADRIFDPTKPIIQPKADNLVTRKPKWDAAKRELSFGDNIIRTVAAKAKNVILVLDAFEESKWEEVTDSPFPGHEEGKEKRRETLRSLNKGLTDILFEADGTGERIRWRVANSDAKSIGLD